MVYVFLGNGFEEIEALTTVDVLRRVNIEVCTVGIGSKVIMGTHSILVTCDKIDSEVCASDDVEAVVIPGGPGTRDLEKSTTVQAFLDFAIENDILIAAICAGPTILANKGILKGKKAICYPSHINELDGAIISDKEVEQDGKIITGKGMGVSTEFALKIAENFIGKEAAENLKGTL